jgi:transcriptional regulator with XRE-family HTH domain
MVADSESIYRAVGKRIRDTREQSVKKMSQAKLAKQLDISRASVVNIEAGRQRAPLHLLWEIAEVLDIDLPMLIPRRAELNASKTITELNNTMRKQIKSEAGGNPTLEETLTNIVGKLLTSIENDPKRNGT